MKKKPDENKTLLFIGYGHGYDDYDILNSLRVVRDLEINIGGLFSLVSERETSALIGQRLDRFRVTPILYQLPVNPDNDMRKLALACALRDLCSAANLRLSPNAEFDSLREVIRARSRRYAVAIGLVAVNRIAIANEKKPGYPTHQRESFRKDVVQELGGCAAIVARVVQACGHSVALVSKIAHDPEGELVWPALSSTKLGDKVLTPISLDHVEQVAPAPSEHLNGFRTWQSFAIEDSRPPYQRTFLDRDISVHDLTLSDKTMKQLYDSIHTYKPPILYFDRFYGNSIEWLFTLSNHEIPQETFLIYETGSEGSPPEYRMEQKIANVPNVVVSSFRFARDFLARRFGKLPDDVHAKLGGVAKQSSSDESSTIDEMLMDDGLKNSFLMALSRAGRHWLRDSNGLTNID